MQKGSIQLIVIGIVVLVIVAAGAFYLGKQVSTPKPQSQTSTTQPTISQPSPSPTPDETANWKTYTNQGLGFTIKYLPVLSIVNDSKEYKDRVYGIECPNCPALKHRQEYSLRFLVPLPLETNSPQIYQPYEGLYIDVIDNSENYAPRDFVENFVALEAAPKPNVEYRPYIVDGLEGITYGIPYQGGLSEEILVNKGDKLYHFALQQSPERGVYEPDLHKSIATFKFLK